MDDAGKRFDNMIKSFLIMFLVLGIFLWVYGANQMESYRSVATCGEVIPWTGCEPREWVSGVLLRNTGIVMVIFPGCILLIAFIGSIATH